MRPLDGQRSAFIMHSEEKTNYNNIHSVLLTLQERVHVKQHVTRTMEPCSTSHLERRGRKRDSLSGDSSLKREREREREREGKFDRLHPGYLYKSTHHRHKDRLRTGNPLIPWLLSAIQCRWPTWPGLVLSSLSSF